MDLFSQILGTITLRPYFVAFFLAYFLACSLHLGVKRALLFAVVGYAIAWAFEYSSIHNGIPFGSYYYIPATKDRELWVRGVPFMDSMSFVFLSYASYSVALAVMSPVVGRFYLLETRRIRHSLGVCFLGALLCMYLDIIIDPVALQGDRWFLGLIYGYPEKGAYFGIPFSNFIGWFIVAFFLIYALQLIDRLLTRRKVKDICGTHCTWRYLLGPMLYLSIMLFNVAVTLAIGEYHLFWADVFILILPLVLFTVIMRSKLHGIQKEAALEAHLQDFPMTVVPGVRVSGMKS